MDAGLAALLSAAATTLVASMTTDGWKQVKAALVGLWRRHPEQGDAAGADLEAARSGVVAAREAGEEFPRAELEAEWRSRLGRLVADDRELQGELRRFTEQFGHLRGGPGSAGRVVMQAEVHDQGRVNQAGRDQTVISE